MADRPLLICDADEVLVHFAAPLKNYLHSKGWTLKFDSFALFGNIRSAESGHLADRAEVKNLIAGFFRDAVETCPPVEHAAVQLAEIAEFADIVILSNVPTEQRARRESSMKALGMPYPVIANEGVKGAKILDLVQHRRAPCAFVDDIPPHHASVREMAPQVHRLHLIADADLQRMLPPAPDAHARIDLWRDAGPHLQRILRQS